MYTAFVTPSAIFKKKKSTTITIENSYFVYNFDVYIPPPFASPAFDQIFISQELKTQNICGTVCIRMQPQKILRSWNRFVLGAFFESINV